MAFSFMPQDNVMQQFSAQEPSFMQPSAPRQNVMQSMGRDPRMGPSMDEIQAKAYADAGVPVGANGQPRRTSVLDIIGGIADTFAELGGQKPQYQATRDARTQRDREAELYPLKKTGMELDNATARTNIADKRTEIMGRAYMALKNVRERYGDEGYRQVAPDMARVFGLSPEDTAFMTGNPDQAMEFLRGLAESGAKGEELGTSIYYATDPEGNLRAFQASKSGGLRQADLPEGFTLQPGVQVVGTGNEQKVIRKPDAKEVASYDVQGGLAPGEVQVEDPNAPGGTRIDLREGSEPFREREVALKDQISGLEKLERTIRSTSSRVRSVEEGLGLRKKSGAMTVPGMNTGERLVAVAQDVIPIVERVFNEDATTGREMIRSAALSIITDLNSALIQAEGSGVQATSKMMDTPKELELKLDTIANARDYKSAAAAFADVKERVESARAELATSIAAKKRELNALRSGGTRQPAAPSGGAPTYRFNPATGEIEDQ